MNNELYKCCTHYKTDTYSNGYVMCKLLPVKVCDNCGEVQSDNWNFWQRLLGELLLPFWNGMVYVEVKQDE
jgi:hypothetical protein